MTDIAISQFYYIILIIFVCLILFVIKNNINKKTIKQKSNAIDCLYEQINKIDNDKTKWKSRAVSLENSIEKSFGLKVRQEIIEIKTDFNKLEWVVMLSGVELLLSRSKTANDAAEYLKIRNKILSFIDHIKEEG